MTQSDLEAEFATRWRQLGLPDVWQAEYRFDTVRRFRFDFADPESRVAVECEGGTWTGGAHVRGKRYASDCTKYNLAQSLGWQVYRLTADMLDDDPAGHLAQIARAVEARTGRQNVLY